MANSLIESQAVPAETGIVSERFINEILKSDDVVENQPIIIFGVKTTTQSILGIGRRVMVPFAAKVDVMYTDFDSANDQIEFADIWNPVMVAEANSTVVPHGIYIPYAYKDTVILNAPVGIDQFLYEQADEGPYSYKITG